MCLICYHLLNHSCDLRSGLHHFVSTYDTYKNNKMKATGLAFASSISVSLCSVFQTLNFLEVQILVKLHEFILDHLEVSACTFQT